MTVPAITNSTASSVLSALGGAASPGASLISDTRDRFLTLLTEQLKNQDPMNPLDNSQMTSQLAQISTVEGVAQLNATLQALLSSSVDSEVMQAAALVGHGVLVPGSGLMMQDGLAAGGIELSEPADSVHITIKDKDGRVVRTLDLKDLDAGITVFEWDGKADDGTPAANGEYTISVEAVRGDAAVSATALQVGVVSSVLRGIQGALLTVGGLGEFRLDEIRQILSDTKKTT